VSNRSPADDDQGFGLLRPRRISKQPWRIVRQCSSSATVFEDFGPDVPVRGVQQPKGRLRSWCGRPGGARVENGSERGMFVVGQGGSGGARASRHGERLEPAWVRREQRGSGAVAGPVVDPAGAQAGTGNCTASGWAAGLLNEKR